MRAGYAWTRQVEQMLALVLGTNDHNLSKGFLPLEQHRMLEVLGGIEMDAWIVGRQSKPMHIWATYCRGRQGIEPVTGLPRPLIDLISQVGRHEDVKEELGLFIAALPNIRSPAVKHWHCFAVASLLTLQQSRKKSLTSHDVQVIREMENELANLIRELYSDLGPINASALAWPSFCLGRQSRSRKNLELVEEVLGRAVPRVGTSGSWGHGGTPIGAMYRQWRSDGVDFPPPRGPGPCLQRGLELVDQSFEVGLW
ncbi:uncharacterized protein CTRU02_212270 [Colletotrichum truncatum]|uniref:Uncharacterized protein n=1 Tax=Colletotrichum truncatum TaxID=5467 RepID=A0ACC3YNA4_COLTU|nr:uncharacterized protein CTRU02_08853 [Colletotrichum truncatum]KAF6789606.1 hypothetical protein CTRU02_08853 [Colletotrichum truncatum]